MMALEMNSILPRYKENVYQKVLLSETKYMFKLENFLSTQNAKEIGNFGKCLTLNSNMND